MLIALAAVLASISPAQSSGGSPVLSGGVQNAASPNIGFRNVKVAPGSVFIIKGAGLGPRSIVYADPPLPDRLPDEPGGTVITFQSTQTGQIYRPQLLHSWNYQVAGVVPENASSGVYNISVSFDGKSSPRETFTVSPIAPGIFTSSMEGDGPGVIQSGDSPNRAAPNQLTNPALPGDSLVVWATGIRGASTSPNDPDRVIVEVGNALVPADDLRPAPGSPGIDLIRFRVPTGADAATGCYVPLRIGAGAAVSNTVTVSISNTRGQCDHPLGFTPEQMARLDGGATLNFAELEIKRRQLPPNDPFLLGVSQFARASAAFYRADAIEVARRSLPLVRPARFGCRIEPGVDRFIGVGTLAVPIPIPSHIDYFPIEGNLVLTNPQHQPVDLTLGDTLTVAQDSIVYHTPNNTPWDFYAGGRWQFAYANPGAIGPFHAEIDLAPAIPFEPPTVVSINAPTIFTWPTTGLTGDQFTTVTMGVKGRNQNEDFDRTIVTIECRVPAKEGGLTLPTDELRWYADQLTGAAGLTFEIAEPQPLVFTAPGLDYAAVTATHKVTRTVALR